MAGTAGINPEFLSRVQAMIAAAPGKVSIGSGFRTRAQQAALFKAKPTLAAPPGRSNHEKGTAIDFVFEGGQEGPVAKWVHANAARFGLKFPMLTRAKGRKYEPWHGEMAGAPPKTMMGLPVNAAASARTQSRIAGDDHDHAGHSDAEVAVAPGEERKDIGVQIESLMNIFEKPLDFSEGKVA